MTLRTLRRWLQVKTGRLDTPIDGEVPFWVLSLGLHLALLVLLAKIFIVPKTDKDVVLVVDVPEQLDIDFQPPEVQFNDIPIEELGADSENAFSMAEAQAPTIQLVNEDPVDVNLPDHEVGDIISDDDFFDASAPSMSPISIKGTVGKSYSGASGAVDRLTQEILLSLQENRTLVVWMFDQSASLIRQRDEIIKRFDRIYDELGLLQAAGNQAFAKYDEKPLLTQVYAFGQNVQPMLKNPTDDLMEIKSSISRIDRDDSGIENVFSAVLKGVDDFRDYRKLSRAKSDKYRNVMFVVVSDEAGDDGQLLDTTVQACTKYQIPVYVIGVPAPFGRLTTNVKWVDPDPNYDQTPQFAPVSQGPESLLPERLNLQFTGGDFSDLEMIDSGFGPFNLTRLCYETNGIYFAVHPNRRNGRVRQTETSAYAADLRYFFDPQIMKKYQPDYVSRAEYLRGISENRARAALVQAAAASQTGQLEAPQYRFPRLDEGEFVRAVSLAQRAPAILQPKLDQLYELLKVGEQDRERETLPRWQAGYDLAYGRVLAARIRTKSYNDMLAMAKTKLKFEDPKNNTWVLEPADSITTGSQDEKLAAKAKILLSRVVENHPGTPWALLASRELQTPIGWRWKEDYTEPPRPRPSQPNNNNNNNIAPRNPQPSPNTMPKERRPVPKL